MHYAAYYAGADMIVQLATWEPLIVDAVNAALITPLHLAAERGRTEETRALLLCGSKGRRQRDIYDFTPLDCARRYGRAEVELLLTNDALQTGKHGKKGRIARSDADQQSDQQ